MVINDTIQPMVEGGSCKSPIESGSGGHSDDQMETNIPDAMANNDREDDNDDDNNIHTTNIIGQNTEPFEADNDMQNVTTREQNHDSSVIHEGNQQLGQERSTKKTKKHIFISYSPDAGFVERKFVVETVRQLKENNLSGDIWFDKDEQTTDSPCWFSSRMEGVDRCKAAILFISENYFNCPVSVYEGKVLIERHNMDENGVKIFPILFSALINTELPKQYNAIVQNMVDLTTGEIASKSLSEKTSMVVGSFMPHLEKLATANIAALPVTPPDTEFTGKYKNRKICQWAANDLQEWLFQLGIKEFFRQSLAEHMVDGFLLMSLTDYDMVNYLGIDSRVTRKKIMQQILHTLDKEHRQIDNWHLRARSQKPKPDCVYLIYDPADVRLAQNIKTDLKKKNVQVIHHDGMRLGRSKEEFLKINAVSMASAAHAMVLLTEASANSPFVFHEVLFADWLGKKLISVMFKNIWDNLRASMKAVLGECAAVDFESKMYDESLDVLEHHIKPLRRIPGVVLEQAYLTKMSDNLQPLEILASPKHGLFPNWSKDRDDVHVFISYQWDMQARVDDIKMALETHGFTSWTDIHATQRGHSSVSGRSPYVQPIIHTHVDSGNESLQMQIQRSMKGASLVLCCVTPKYLQSDSCMKDLTLAETLHKPVIPILLRFAPFEGAPPQVRRILSRCSYYDLSNDRLYKQNLPHVIEKVRKTIKEKSHD